MTSDCTHLSMTLSLTLTLTLGSALLFTGCGDDPKKTKPDAVVDAEDDTTPIDVEMDMADDVEQDMVDDSQDTSGEDTEPGDVEPVDTAEDVTDVDSAVDASDDVSETDMGSGS